MDRAKLLNKCLGLFELLSRKGAVANKVRLPAAASVNKVCIVFHMSLLSETRMGTEDLLHWWSPCCVE